jgi:hypothetical protein
MAGMIPQIANVNVTPTGLGALALLFLGLVIMMLVLGRRKRWGLVFWVPAITLPIIWSYALLSPVPWRGNFSGPDGGAWGMGVGFYLMMAGPLVVLMAVIWIAAIIKTPRGDAWNVMGGVLGALLTLAIWFGWHRVGTQETQIVVLDSHGMPVAGQKVEFHSYNQSLDGSKILGTGISNDLGIVSMHVPGDNWSATTRTSDGTDCTVYYNSRPNQGLHDHPDYAQYRWYWRNSTWGDWVYSSISIYRPPNSSRPMELRLRNADELYSVWILEMLKREVEAVRAGHQHDWRLADIGRTDEMLDVIPEVLTLIRNKQLDNQDADALLDEIAERLGMAAAAVANYGPNAGESVTGPYRFLENWVKREAAVDGHAATSELIMERLQDLAGQWVETTKPNWPTDGPRNIEKLGQLMKPYYGEMLQVMQQMPGEGFNKQIIFLAVTRFGPKPDLDQMQPFFDSPDRMTAVTALASVKSKLSKDELLQRLNALSKPDKHSWVQNQIDSLLQDLGQQSNS